jgi:hypothetical protein
MYFDGYDRKKQQVLNDFYHREVGPIDREIVHYQREQEKHRRAARRSKLLLNFRAADHNRYMESLYQYKEADANVRRDQILGGMRRMDLRHGPDWGKANTDDGYLSDRPLSGNDQSALTGSGNPPNARTLRKYNQAGGLRVPLELHQADLERMVPRDQNGMPLRTPDPRGAYVQLLNDGGPSADPTRGVNCLDCSLSFFETYVHGRPTVSAPRTVDTYSKGGRDWHVGERDGHFRAEDATGSSFTQVTPNVSHKAPADAKVDIDNAFASVARTLLQGGHGSTAIIINQWEGPTGHGGWHAWNAVNHNGTLYFIDPQTGDVRDATNFAGGPGHRTLYGHSGTTNGANVVTVNALMVDGQGNPMSVPNTPPAPYHSRQPVPPPPPLAYQQQQAQLQQQINTPPPPPMNIQPPVNTQPPPPQVSTPPPSVHQRNPQPPAPAVETRPAPAVETAPAPTVAPPTVRTAPSPTTDDGSARTPQTRNDPAPEPAPKPRVSDPLSVLEPHPTKTDSDPLSVLEPNRITPAETRDVADQRGRENYDYANHRTRHDYADNHRQDVGRDLRNQARARENRADDLTDAIRAADRRGDLAAVDRHRAERDQAMEDAYDLRAQARDVESGGDLGDVELTGDDWERVNEVDGGNDLAPGPVETGDRSALTGDNGSRPVDMSRRYNQRGGLRPPLAIHQTDLERAVPRDDHGNPVRHADPRDGNWFGLQNDGGPEADPTRSNNCGDTVLSFFDTWMHGRPRVSAPRTFDGYHHGNPNRPIGAERGVTARIESTTGGRFEGLTEVSPTADPQDARDQVRLAQSRLRNHLLSLGHGSMAFITTQDQAGRTHEVAAINQNGTILYLDPQNRSLNDRHPIPTHTGNGFPSDVVRMDALTVDGRARPRPLTTGDGPFIAADPAGVGVNPDAYDGEQLEDMHRHGSELGLTREQVDDFVKTGSIEKPANPPKRMEPKAALTPDEVKQQMDNWSNEVERRGYPYLFQSREQFEAFVGRVQQLHAAYALPNGRVLVQGSSLRTPNAGDVDVAVIVSDEEFDAYVARCEDGITRRASARARDRVLEKLADNVSKGFVSSFYIDRPSKEMPGFGRAVHEVVDEFSLPDIDFSVMRESSVLMMYPWMELAVGRA